MKSVWKILVCSASLLLCGCNLTLGPVVERKAIIVQAGVPIEILEQVRVRAHVLKKDGESDVFKQDIGGWIAIHPDHWKTLKAEIKRLRENAHGTGH